jgi:hypothetical protein
MFSYALWLSPGDARMAANAGFGLWPNALPRLPVHAFERIHQNCSFHRIPNYWESERIRFSLADERANDYQTTGEIVGLIDQHPSRAAAALLASGLRIKIQPRDSSSLRDVAHYHSTISLPLSRPPCGFLVTILWRDLRHQFLQSRSLFGSTEFDAISCCLDHDRITSSRWASWATALGIRAAKLLPPLTPCAFNINPLGWM